MMPTSELVAVVIIAFIVGFLGTWLATLDD